MHNATARDTLNPEKTGLSTASAVTLTSIKGAVGVCVCVGVGCVDVFVGVGLGATEVNVTVAGGVTRSSSC